MEKTWLKQYPAGVPGTIDVEQYASLVALLDESFRKYGDRNAYKFMGKAITFAQVDDASRALAAYLQSLGLEKGDRIAVMMPNVPQYPVAVAAILRAGYVVVNVNPLYTPRELEHQLKDSGAKCILIVENFAATLSQVMAAVPTKHVIVSAVGDMLGFPKSMIVNYVLRKVKKAVPAFHIPGIVHFNQAIAQGRGKTFKPAAVGPDDIAVLQYTGGTTGVSKGAVLLHRNLVANILQSEAWYQPALKKIPAGEQLVTICALPIYHIFGFNTNVMLGMRMGGCNILIPNPRDLPSMFKVLVGEKFHSFPAVSTLFLGMAHHADFGTVDWSHLKISVGGGMAVQSATAKLWLEKTGCPIVEGYGLSETSPSVTCNPVDSTAYSGNIGLPMPNTEVTLLDDDGNEVPVGTPGEIAIRGPQVMAGYWQRPDETAKVMTADGYFRSGDVGVVDERGYFRIVDRKKDMILVSGFNVYPNEVE
ncbi:MAG: AMP-binding protein, partial [Caldimonas sp.]